MGCSSKATAAKKENLLIPPSKDGHISPWFHRLHD